MIHRLVVEYLIHCTYPFLTARRVIIFSSTQLQKFRGELENQLHVLKMLSHINSEGVVQLKGRAACLIESGDGLLITETMFNGTHLKWLSVFTFFICNPGSSIMMICCGLQVHLTILIIIKLLRLLVAFYHVIAQARKHASLVNFVSQCRN